MSHTQDRPGHRVTSLLTYFASVLLAALLLVVPQAIGATVTDRPVFSFNGADTTAGPLVKPNKIAIDNSNGAVYVSEGAEGPQWRLSEVVSKFDANGAAATFSATGESSLNLSPGHEDPSVSDIGIAVDNSGTATQGRLYIVTSRTVATLKAYEPSGTPLWEISDVGSFPQDVAVDKEGHIWVLLGDNTLKEFASTGSRENPPSQIGFCAIEGNPHGLDLDAAGTVYLAGFSNVGKYAGCAFSSIVDPTSSLDVFADQSEVNGHLFTSHQSTGDFNEYDINGNLIGSYGAGAIAVPRGIAYNKALDRVYVANSGLNIIEVFGPPITATVPDPTIEATSSSGPGTATFHGSINPEGVANAYYFEWVEASESGISFANETKRFFRSPLQSVPEDGSSHPVEYHANNLFGNLKWDVRLVGVNTTSKLRAASGSDTFKPPKASANPIAVIEQPSELEPESVRINGAINPEEDSVQWRVEYTADPNCNPTGSWTKGAIEYLPGGEVDAPLVVQYKLEGLQATQRYCVRLRANNSFDPFGAGSTTEVREFTTPALPPGEVSTAFTAPRTDTSARINGRVNPEGSADFKYQFEWSEDGTTWHLLPLRESTVDAHEPIVVSDELANLTPATAYLYRLAVVENETGPAAAVGDVKQFTTRTSAEMILPPNAFGEANSPGIELVNNPDKGNQNVFFETISKGPIGEVPFISPDGNFARWSVTAGAPGAVNGVGAQFLAERTPSGWQSRSLAPPASQQPGGGANVYNIAAANPAQSLFVADLRAAGLSSRPGSTLVRLDTSQNEETLHTFNWSVKDEGVAGVDVSDNGAHVLTVDPETKQLVDIGEDPPQTISLMPGDDLPSTCGLVSYGHGVYASFVGGAQWRNGYHMMATAAANIVYFRAKADGKCNGPWGLYVRDGKAEHTTLIDLGVDGHDVEFIRATPNGNSAYFLTASQLEGSDRNSGVDLYVWNQLAETATCLTCVVQDADIRGSSGGEAVSPVLISDDFSHAYFVSRRRLVANQGVQGGENIYVLSGGAVRFVATASQLELTTEVLNRTNAKLSSNGGALIFSSSQGEDSQLTADAISCGPCVQLYRYEDDEGSVECVSCASSGATTVALGAGGGVGQSGAFDMSADGSTVGIVTVEALARHDVNNAADVYQWRNGVRRLITEGTGEAQSGSAAPGVRGIDSTGGNMLFSVVEPGRTGFEQDGLTNLYDARIGGGFVPAPTSPHCVEDSCQGPLVPAAPVERVSSANSSRGNLKPSRCTRKRGRTGRRCTPRHKNIRHHRDHSHLSGRSHHAGGRK